MPPILDLLNALNLLKVLSGALHKASSLLPRIVQNKLTDTDDQSFSLLSFDLFLFYYAMVFWGVGGLPRYSLCSKIRVRFNISAAGLNYWNLSGWKWPNHQPFSLSFLNSSQCLMLKKNTKLISFGWKESLAVIKIPRWGKEPESLLDVHSITRSQTPQVVSKMKSYKFKQRLHNPDQLPRYSTCYMKKQW